MHIKTLLRHVHPIKGFSYDRMQLCGTRGSEQLHCSIRPHRRNMPLCSECGTVGPIYDRLPARTFRMVPLWGIPVLLLYAMRRVSCPQCDRVVVERVPWAEGKSPMTTVFMIFLASWVRAMTWKETGKRFQVSWDTVYRAVEWVVAYGKAHRTLDHITAIGVDEIQRSHGHRYLTLVYQIDAGCRRLRWIGRGRSHKSFKPFFTWLGVERCARVRYFGSDMWKLYLNLIAKHAPNAINVLDRFHLVAKLGKAVDKVRSTEVVKLRATGKEVLVRTKWIWLKQPVNLTNKQRRYRRDCIAQSSTGISRPEFAEV